MPCYHPFEDESDNDCDHKDLEETYGYDDLYYEGFNRGYDEDGFALGGFDEDGYDENGFNEDSYNEDGFNGHGFDKNGHDENDFNEDGFDEYSRKRKRSKSKKKSEAAEKQEKAAIAAFDAQKKSTEIQVAKVCSQGDAQTNVTVQLLKPSEHLTGLCWSTFAKYVKQSPGWTAKRREATSAEKVEHKETRKHKCYFVDVIYTPVAGGKPAKEHSVPLPSKKKAKGAISSSSAKWKDGANTATAISVDDEPPTKKTKAVAS